MPESSDARRSSMQGGVPDKICRISMHEAAGEADISIERRESIPTNHAAVEEEDEEKPIVRGEVVNWQEVETAFSPKAPYSLEEAFEILSSLAPELVAGWQLEGGPANLVKTGGVESCAQVMLEASHPIQVRRAATRLWLRLSDVIEATEEEGFDLKDIEAFELDLSCAVGSDFAAIIPVPHLIHLLLHHFCFPYLLKFGFDS